LVGACEGDRRTVTVAGTRGRPPYVHHDATVVYDMEVVEVVEVERRRGDEEEKGGRRSLVQTGDEDAIERRDDL
jgi:hypothetical protein